MKNFLFAIVIALVSLSSTEGFSQTPSTLTIEGNQIWIRETPKTGKVVFKLDEGAVCRVLKKGERQVIRGQEDFWYKIEHNGKTGWVFGSQASIRQKAKFDNFEHFLKYFLNTCYFGNNLDSLMYSKSDQVYQFIHPKIGLTRLLNPGVACVPSDYNFFAPGRSNFSGMRHPKEENVQYFKQRIPNKGFCEKSNDKNGVYHQTIMELPKYPDVKNNYEIKKIPVPVKYKNGQKIIVQILKDGWITKKFYFMEADGKWWLVVINDCDCSA